MACREGNILRYERNTKKERNGANCIGLKLLIEYANRPSSQR